MTNEQATQFVVEMKAVIVNLWEDISSAICLHEVEWLEDYKEAKLNEILDEEKYNQLIDFINKLSNKTLGDNNEKTKATAPPSFT